MKSLTRIVLGAVLGSFAGIALHYFLFGWVQNDLRSVRWGMNKSEVKSVEKDLVVASEEEDSIVFESELIYFLGKQRAVILSYNFDKHGLHGACFNLNPEKLHKPNVQSVKEFYEIRKKLSKHYGPPSTKQEQTSLQNKVDSIHLLSEWKSPNYVHLELLQKGNNPELPYSFYVCYKDHNKNVETRI